MSRRFGVLFTATILFGLVLLASPVSAAFTGSCATGTSTNYQLYQHRDPTDARINGVIGEAWIKPLTPCTANATHWSQSVVLPANMQYAYDARIVQLGYGYCNPTPGSNCAIGNGGPHFLFTPRDDNQILSTADGAGQYGSAPILNHRYRFRIYPDGSQQKWWYCIRDLSTGEAYRCWWVLRLSGSWNTAGTGSNVWWGAETANSNDQMGNANGTTEIGMQWMQYRKVGQSTYIVIDGLGAATKKPSTGFPSYYKDVVVNTNDTDGNGSFDDHDGMNIHTLNH